MMDINVFLFNVYERFFYIFVTFFTFLTFLSYTERLLHLCPGQNEQKTVMTAAWLSVMLVTLGEDAAVKLVETICSKATYLVKYRYSEVPYVSARESDE